MKSVEDNMIVKQITEDIEKEQLARDILEASIGTWVVGSNLFL